MDLVIPNVEVHESVVESIRGHSERQDAKGGYEAVGFMAKEKDSSVITATLVLNNHAPDPTIGFFVEPWEQFRAEQKLEDQGYEIAGVYHSHPRSEALPSQMDHKLARPGEFVFIHSVIFNQLTSWKEQDGQLMPVQLVIP